MYGDFDTELRGDVEPKRQAMTSGDALMIVVLLAFAWCAVIGFVRVVQWLAGINPGVL